MVDETLLVISKSMHGAQLKYWNDLLLIIKKEVPYVYDLFNNIENDKKEIQVDMNMLDDSSWSWLQIIFNNVFVNIDSSNNVPLIYDYHNSGHSAIFSSGLCRNHLQDVCCKTFETQPIITFDYDPLLIPNFPLEIHPVLLSILIWYVPSYTERAQHLCFPNFRVYQQIQNNFSFPHHHIIPMQILSLKHLYELKNHHMNMHYQLALEKQHYLTCKYCYPSPLGIATNALERKLINLNCDNIPKGLLFKVLTLNSTYSNDNYTLLFQHIKTLQPCIHALTPNKPQLAYTTIINHLWLTIIEENQNKERNLLLMIEQFTFLLQTMTSNKLTSIIQNQLLQHESIITN